MGNPGRKNASSTSNERSMRAASRERAKKTAEIQPTSNERSMRAASRERAKKKAEIQPTSNKRSMRAASRERAKKEAKIQPVRQYKRIREKGEVKKEQEQEQDDWEIMESKISSSVSVDSCSSVIVPPPLGRMTMDKIQSELPPSKIPTAEAQSIVGTAKMRGKTSTPKPETTAIDRVSKSHDSPHQTRTKDSTISLATPPGANFKDDKEKELFANIMKGKAGKKIHEDEARGDQPSQFNTDHYVPSVLAGTVNGVVNPALDSNSGDQNGVVSSCVKSAASQVLSQLMSQQAESDDGSDSGESVMTAESGHNNDDNLVSSVLGNHTRHEIGEGNNDDDDEHHLKMSLLPSLSNMNGSGNDDETSLAAVNRYFHAADGETTPLNGQLSTSDWANNIPSINSTNHLKSPLKRAELSPQPKMYSPANTALTTSSFNLMGDTSVDFLQDTPRSSSDLNKYESTATPARNKVGTAEPQSTGKMHEETSELENDFVDSSLDKNKTAAGASYHRPYSPRKATKARIRALPRVDDSLIKMPSIPSVNSAAASGSPSATTSANSDQPQKGPTHNSPARIPRRAETKENGKDFNVVSSPSHSGGTDTTAACNKKSGVSLASSPDTQKRENGQDKAWLKTKKTFGKEESGENDKAALPFPSASANSKKNGNSSRVILPLAASGKELSAKRNTRKERKKTSPSQASRRITRRSHRRALPAKKIACYSSRTSAQEKRSTDAAKLTEAATEKTKTDTSRPSEYAAGTSSTIVSDPPQVRKTSKSKGKANGAASESVTREGVAVMPSVASVGDGSHDASKNAVLNKIEEPKESPEVGPSRRQTKAYSFSEENKECPSVAAPPMNITADNSVDRERITRRGSNKNTGQPWYPMKVPVAKSVACTKQMRSADINVFARTKANNQNISKRLMSAKSIQKEIGEKPTEIAPQESEIREANHDSSLRVLPRYISPVEKEQRLTNPLLSVFPPMPESVAPRNVSESLAIVEVSLPRPDTYPITFQAGCLGFEVSPNNFDEAQSFLETFNTGNTLPEDETIYSIPKAGLAYPIWEDQETRFVNEKCMENVNPPLYKILLREGWNEEYLERPRLATDTFELLAHNVVEKFVEEAYHRKLIHAKSWTFKRSAPDEKYALGGEKPNWLITACRKPDGGDSQQSLELHYGINFYNYSLELSENVVVTCNDIPIGDLSKISTDSDLRTALVLLYALMLEHCRACGANYCFVEADVTTASILRACFRMDQVPSEHNSIGRSNLKFVCDVHKCSSKYALLQIAELGSAKACRGQIERVCISIPTSDKSRARRIKSNNSANFNFSGAGKTSRKTVVGVQVKFSVASPSELIMNLVDEEGVAKEHLGAAFKTAVTDLEWNIEKSFLVPRATENKEDRNLFHDEVFDKLKLMQDDLGVMEKRMCSTIGVLVESIIEERKQYESDAEERQKRQKTLDEYKERFSGRDLGRTWKQAADDMECVCLICNDGEVTPHNRIVFCEGCEISIHQKCYGIKNIPYGHYYCRLCENDRNATAGSGESNGVAANLSSVVCELCPRPGGAFKRLQHLYGAPGDSLWVHVTCAKWQNLRLSKEDIFEDPTQFINKYRNIGVQCCLCDSSRGAFSKCHEQNCENYVHVTCARDSRVCTVVDGSTVGNTEKNIGSSVFCPEHSAINISDLQLEGVPKHVLVNTALNFQDETTPFPKLSIEEQTSALSCPEYELDFLRELESICPGSRCSICDHDWNKDLVRRCFNCKEGLCYICPDKYDGLGNSLCEPCSHTSSMVAAGQRCDLPQCIFCATSGGWMRKAQANPTNSRRSYWKKHPEEYQKTLFAKTLWCHSICARSFLDEKQVNPSCIYDISGFVESTKGLRLTRKRGESGPCDLCGRKDGIVAKCATTGCNRRFHPTCARQAGFTVKDLKTFGGKAYSVLCFEHCQSENNLRAFIEELLYEEVYRMEQTKNRPLDADTPPRTYKEAGQLLSLSVRVMRVLGWAWRWEDWWVQSDYFWEPYLPFMKEGQTEEDYSDEVKRVVHSTEEVRRKEADESRLADFSVALRNRAYDTPDGCDDAALSRALRSLLDKCSIVGPLKNSEKDLLMEWLPRAYRSQTKDLGFGKDKTQIGNARFCYYKDGSPKFELCDREIPGHDEPACKLQSEPIGCGRKRERPARATAEVTTVAESSNRAKLSPTPLFERKRVAAFPERDTSERVEEKIPSGTTFRKPRTKRIAHEVPLKEQTCLSRKRARCKEVSSPLEESHNMNGLQMMPGSASDLYLQNPEQDEDSSSTNRDAAFATGFAEVDDEKEISLEQEEKKSHQDEERLDDSEEDDVGSVVAQRSHRSYRMHPNGAPTHRISKVLPEDITLQVPEVEQVGVVQFASPNFMISGAASVKSRVSAARNSVSSRKPRIQHPLGMARIDEEQPPHRRPSQLIRKGAAAMLGTKDNPVVEKEHDDDSIAGEEPALVDRLIVVKQADDEISRFTCKTTGSPRTYKVNRLGCINSKLSEAEEEKLERALEMDKKKRFEVTSGTLRCLPVEPSAIDAFKNHSSHCRPDGLRSTCVLCCKTCNKGGRRTPHKRAERKTRWGCQDCYLDAFENHYKVRIDRMDVPEILAKRAVYLCTEPPDSAGDDALSCFEIWHSMDPLPPLKCGESGEGPSTRQQSLRNCTK